MEGLFTANNFTHVFPQLLPYDLVDILYRGLGSVTVQHPHGGHVLVGQQVLQGAYVLPHLDETTPVEAAKVAQTLGRSQVHLVDKMRINDIRFNLFFRPLVLQVCLRCMLYAITQPYYANWCYSSILIIFKFVFIQLLRWARKSKFQMGKYEENSISSSPTN